MITDQIQEPHFADAFNVASICLQFVTHSGQTFPIWLRFSTTLLIHVTIWYQNCCLTTHQFHTKNSQPLYVKVKPRLKSNVIFTQTSCLLVGYFTDGQSSPHAPIDSKRIVVFVRLKKHFVSDFLHFAPQKTSK